MIKNIFLIVIIMLNITLIFKRRVERKYFEEEKKGLMMKVEINNNQFLQEMDLLAQEVSINYDSVFKSDSRKSMFLIYTYSGEECNKCILQDIFALKEKLKKDEVNDVIIIPVLENSRNANIGLKADLAGLNYKRLDKGHIKFPYQNGIQRRFFAILTRKGKILLPFFPEVSSPERTNAYLDFVFKKYLCNNQDSIRNIK